MSTKRCYYETLEVERTADDGKLKAAFRKLAMKWHPDKNPGDASSEVRFKEINEAYEVLKDGEKRAAYDRFGHAAFEQGMGGGGPGFGTDFASAFSDIFEDIFGMAGAAALRWPRARRRSALQHGNHARGSVSRQDRAGRDSDLGHLRALLGHRRQGRHQAEDLLDMRRRGPRAASPGLLHAGADLPWLSGPWPDDRGRLPELRRVRTGDARADAVGQHSRRASRTAPAFVWPAKAKPACAVGRPATSIFSCRWRTHEFFQRDGADLHCRVPISMVAAALGGEFEVPTIDKGKTKVKVPAGTQSGRRFRIASKGMPVLRSRQTGDMYVQVMVETPQNLTKKQQELLAEFEKLSSGDTQPEAAGFFTKVKDFFGSRAG